MASINLDPHTWFHVLQAIFRELSTEMTEEKRNEKIKEANAINTKLSKYLAMKNSRGYAELNNDLYQDLHKYEIFLREILDNAGLQTKRLDDATRALG